MEELISRITSSVGIDASTTQSAVGIILDFLNKEGPQDAVSQVLDAIPGARGAVEAAAGGGSGGLMGSIGSMMGGGGGLMAAAGRLMSAGLGMGEIQQVTQETIAFAREKAGDEVVSKIIAAIPGLDQFA